MKTLLGLALVALAAACGPPTQYDTCKHGCDWVYNSSNCPGSRDRASYLICNEQCDQTKSQFTAADKTIDDGCRNAGTIHTTIFACVETCDSTAANQCIGAAVQLCVAK